MPCWADYGLRDATDGAQRAHHVHIILCNRAGDWVLVDFQNSHHADFQGIDPKTVDDCNQLVVLRAKRFNKRIAESK